MYTPLAIATADNHLLVRQWAKHPEVEFDAFVAFDEVVKLCNESGLPLFICGDLFDSTKPDAESVTFYMRAAQRLQQAIYFVLGDHDYTEDYSWAALAQPRAQHIHDTVLRLGPFNFYGLDYTPRGPAQQQLASIPHDADVLVTHFKWSDLQQLGRTCASLCDVRNVQQIVSGDFHACRTVTGSNADGKPTTLWSPGSSVPTAIDLFSTRHVLQLGYDTDNPRQLQCHSIPLRQTRVGRTVQLTTADDLDRVINETFAELLRESAERELSSLIETPVLRVRYRDDIPDAYERLTAAADRRIILFLEPEHVVEEVVVTQTVGAERASRGLAAAVVALSAGNSQLQADGLRLLAATDKAAEVQRMYLEHRADSHG